MTSSTPKATFNNLVHRYEFPAEGVTFQLDRFDQGRDGAINCEVEVFWAAGRLRPPTRTNLLAEQTLTRLANNLKLRTKGAELDWDEMLGKVATSSIARYRLGDAPVDLTTVSSWRERPRFTLWPFIEASGDTVLFADGGSGKSTIALILCVMVATGCPLLPETRIEDTGPVLYLDYEADEVTHAERLEAIRCGVDPRLEVPAGAIIYKRMYAPIHEAVDDLVKVVTQYGVKLIVVDSLGRARGGAPEGSDETLRAFNAMARLGAPRLLIDHLSKEAIFNADMRSSRPIGSIYTHNNARLTWSITAADSQYDDDILGTGHHQIQLINHKNNNGRLQGRRTYSLTYYSDDGGRLTGIYVSSINPESIPDFMRLQPLWKRCVRMIEEQGPATTEQLADWLGAKKSEIERNLIGQRDRFWRDVRGGVTYWQLVEQEPTVAQGSLEEWFAGDDEKGSETW